MQCNHKMFITNLTIQDYCFISFKWTMRDPDSNSCKISYHKVIYKMNKRQKRKTFNFFNGLNIILCPIYWFDAMRILNTH